MKQFPSRPDGGMWAIYGLTGLASLAFDVAMSRIRFRKIRLIRRPYYIRGRRWIVWGPRLTCGRGLRLDALGHASTAGPLIQFGSDVALNDYVHIGANESVVIGNRVLIASKVFISDHDHGAYGKDGQHTDPRIAPWDRPIFSSPVVIEDDVWIGESVSVLAGVRIGRGAIIGAMSTVTKDIPPYCIAVGSPARVIKKFNFTDSAWERV